MDKIKISLRGRGITIVKGNIENELWERMNEVSKEFEMKKEDGVFDSDYIEKLGSERIKTWMNFDNLLHIYGLSNNERNIIEFKVNANKKRKIFFGELLNQDSLFKLYDSEIIEINIEATETKKITIVESDIGLTAKYYFETNTFNIDKLKFIIHKVKVEKYEYTILSKLIYDNKELKGIKNDSLVTNCYAVIE